MSWVDTDKYSQLSSIIWSVWPNGWVFVYELSGCGFKSSCSHLHIKCVGISSAHYEKLQNDTKPWFCPNCSKERPFSDAKDKDLCNTMHIQSTPQTHFTNVPDKKSKELIHKFWELKNLFDQSENTIRSDYYDLTTSIHCLRQSIRNFWMKAALKFSVEVLRISTKKTS